MKRLSIVLALLFVARGVDAAPITFQESVSGDLATSPVRSFTLDLGANTVAGHASAIPNIPDDDPFDVVIPAGMTLSSISFLHSDGVGTLPNPMATLFLYDLTPSMTQLGSVVVPLTNGGTVSFLPALMPLPADTYRVLLQMPLFFGAAGIDFNYTWTLNVAEQTLPVPEPVSMALFSVGVAGLGVHRWRTRFARRRGHAR